MNIYHLINGKYGKIKKSNTQKQYQIQHRIRQIQTIFRKSNNNINKT
jgi:hypothetical protein